MASLPLCSRTLCSATSPLSVKVKEELQQPPTQHLGARSGRRWVNADPVLEKQMQTHPQSYIYRSPCATGAPHDLMGDLSPLAPRGTCNTMGAGGLIFDLWNGRRVHKAEPKESLDDFLQLLFQFIGQRVMSLAWLVIVITLNKSSVLLGRQTSKI